MNQNIRFRWLKAFSRRVVSGWTVCCVVIAGPSLLIWVLVRAWEFPSYLGLLVAATILSGTAHAFFDAGRKRERYSRWEHDSKP